MVKFWVSFWSADLSKFEYHGPWWVSGYRGDECGEQSVCAAVVAKDEEHAKHIIEAAHDEGHAPAEGRFVDAREDAWSPFCDRFTKAKWMKWPWPARSDDAGT